VRDYIIRFYPDTPILCYTYTVFDVPYSHLQIGERQELARQGKHTFKTGNMDGYQFDRLVRDISEYGIINPFIIEYYSKPPGKPPSLSIRTGNNRACAMEQLGLSRAKALFVVPRKLAHALPSEDDYVELGIRPGLLEEIDALWCEVRREAEEHHNGDLGTDRAWTDSNLLLEIVRSTLPEGGSISRVKQRRVTQ
jgi:hypothetical protein